MDSDHDMEPTLPARPVPTTEDPLPPATADELSPGFIVEPRGTAPEDVSHHEDTVAGDVAFLARYAFGGY